MTIKELEERTGMPRANIRYYEDEKLISPLRQPNGYRDYSEEDVRTLEKIKLLRQLHLDIETIRQVQQGQLTLEQALFNQLTRLEGDRNAIDRAVDVCRRLERSGVEYGALEPQTWLEELKKPSLPPAAPAKKPEPPKEPPTEAQLWAWSHPASDHPWMRYFARSIDVILTRTVIDFLGFLLFPGYMTLDLPLVVEWFLAICLLAFTLALEPLWLHFWGYTPGKWIFGLKLRDNNGEKLSLSAGYARAFRVFRDGYGFNLPIYNYICLWKGRRCCMNAEDCYWDVYEGNLYGRQERRLYGLYIVGAYALSLTAALLMVLGSHMPPNRDRDGLTLAEYSENYNHILTVNDLDGSTPMEEDGTFRPAEPDSGHYVINISGLRALDPQYTLEDGVLKEVVLQVGNDGDGGICRWSLERETLHLLAFSGAAGGNVFNYGRTGWVRALESCPPWEDSTVEHRGFRVTVDCEFSGYTGAGSDYLFPVEGKEQSLIRTVTITWIGENGS